MTEALATRAKSLGWQIQMEVARFLMQHQTGKWDDALRTAVTRWKFEFEPLLDNLNFDIAAAGLTPVALPEKWQPKVLHAYGVALTEWTA